MTFTGKRTGRPDSVRRPRAENAVGPALGGQEGGPGPRPKAGMPEEGGVPSGGVPGRLGRDAARQPRGNPGPGRPPWPTGRGGIGRRGPVTAPAGRSPRAWSPPARRSPGHAAGRAPVHLPGGVQVHLHGGGGAAWPRAAGSRGARGHRDGHGGGGGRGRGRGGRRRGGRGRRGGLGQLGGRRLLRRRLLLLRRRLRRGLGDPGAPLAAAAPGASGTTARPSAFRHGPAGGGEARGLRGSRRRPRGPPRLLPRQRRGLDSSAQPARSSARARAARTREASRRAVLALARRCLLRLAPPRHWVGVSGERAGSPGPRPPHPAPGGGTALRRARPSLLGGGGRRLGALRRVLSLNLRPGGSPLNLAAHFSPLSFSAVAAEPSGNSAFPGRGPGPERAAAGARLGPSGV